MHRLRGAVSRAVTRVMARSLRGRTQGPLDVLALLGRPAVNLDTPELQRFLAGKRVLVTGAGGSIGSEICRQAARFCPSRVVLVERCENALFEIDRELRWQWVGLDVHPTLADITDEERIEQIFQTHRPQVIFHCAAHKHVPMMEINAAEAVKNNVFGTKTVADAARRHGAAAFVMVSTDKAVNPTSVMGATKRCAEIYVQSLNQAIGVRSQGSDISGLAAHPSSPTRFVAVRFGNVLGSSGSVVPIFRKQIDAGGPVTVTHPDMRRYFMTIPEASQLVMQAGAIGRGGEIFVLDMGEPVKIVELARAMIEHAGLRVGKDIEIEFTGVRPGEKLFEELACDGEETAPTSHRKIFVWELRPAGKDEVTRMLTLLRATHGVGAARVIETLKQIVPEYQTDSPAKPARPLRVAIPEPSAEAA